MQAARVEILGRLVYRPDEGDEPSVTAHEGLGTKRRGLVVSTIRHEAPPIHPVDEVRQRTDGRHGSEPGMGNTRSLLRWRLV